MTKREWHGMLEESIDLKLRDVQLKVNQRLLKDRTHISRANLVNICLKKCFEKYTIEQIIQNLIDEFKASQEKVVK